MSTRGKTRTWIPCLLAALIFASGAGLEAAKKRSDQASQSADNDAVAKGRMVFGQSCIQCHTMNIVLIQRKSAEGWRNTVYSMISRGTELTPDEIEPLVAYLTATYGPGSPAAATKSKSATSAETGNEGALPEGAGKQILSHACVQCHGLSLVTATRLSEPGWEATIARMVSFGAKLSSADRETLTAYLAQNLSNKKQ